MKKQLTAVFLLSFSCILLSCGKYNKSSVEGTDTKDSKTSNYSYSFSVEKTKEQNAYNLNYKVENTGDPLSVGLMVFVDGIPQQYSLEGKTSYLLPVSAATNEKKELAYSLLPINNTGKDKGTIRFASMLEPENIDSKDPAFNIGNLQKIIQIGPSEIAMNQSGTVADVKDLKGTLVNSDSTRMNMSEYIGESMVSHSLIWKQKLATSYSLKISSDTASDYILSFWADGSPIKLGEAKYYRISLGKGECISYQVPFTETVLKDIHNFYVVLCPVDEDKTHDILKTPTMILSDGQVDYPVEETESHKETEPAQGNTNLTDKAICAAYNKIAMGYGFSHDTSGKFLLDIVKIDTKNNSILSECKPVGFDVFPAIKMNASGVLCQTTGRVLVLDANLKKDYDGSLEGYFKKYDVSTYFLVLDSWCYGYDDQTDAIVAKQLGSDMEKMVYTPEKKSSAVSDFYTTGNNIITSGIYRDNTTYTCISKDNKPLYFDNRIMLSVSENNTGVLMYEPVPARSPEKPYCFVYDLINGKDTTIHFSNSEETTSVRITPDGLAVVTYLLKKDGSMDVYRYDVNKDRQTLIKTLKNVSSVYQYYFLEDKLHMDYYDGENQLMHVDLEWGN